MGYTGLHGNELLLGIRKMQVVVFAPADDPSHHATVANAAQMVAHNATSSSIIMWTSCY